MENKINIRPAREEDTDDVMELTSHIWEGDDYVPYVWAEWLADPLGCLLVAETQGRVVGLAKVSQSTPEDWWLQGLRVHPEFEGQGIASHLHEACLDYWREHGRGAIRLATNSQRYPVHHLCERTGFKKVGEYSYFQASTLSQAGSDFTPLLPEQVNQALDYSLNSPSLALTTGYIDMGWEWLPPRLEAINKTIQRGQALWWKDKQGLLLYREDQDEGQDNLPVLVIEWIACKPGNLAALLMSFRQLASTKGYQDAGWTVPLNPELISILASAGFARKWDGSVYLFEKTGGL